MQVHISIDLGFIHLQWRSNMTRELLCQTHVHKWKATNNVSAHYRQLLTKYNKQLDVCTSSTTSKR